MKRIAFAQHCKKLDCKEKIARNSCLSFYVLANSWKKCGPLRLEPSRLSLTNGDDANATFYSIDCVSAGRRPLSCRQYGPCRVGSGRLTGAQRAVGAGADSASRAVEVA